MVPATASVVWSDGQLHLGDVADELEVDLGLLLGMSPVVHVERGLLAREHAQVLCEAAALLGYEGLSPGRVEDAVRELPVPAAAVVVVPTAEHHRATPAGTSWRLVELPPRAESVGDVDLVVSPLPRSGLPEVASLVLWDDTELAAAAAVHPDGVRPGVDSLLRLDGNGHVARAGDAALVARVGGELLTPRLADGAPRTAWRHVLLDGVHETSLAVDLLTTATSIALLGPAGSVRAVRSLDARPLAELDLADEQRARLDVVRDREARP